MPIDGAQVLAMRAAGHGFCVPGEVSAGGGCRLMAARTGWVALNLSRADDRTLLPALFSDTALDPADDAAIAARVLASDAPALVARGREMGLAIARTGEHPAAPALVTLARAPTRAAPPARAPLVLDLSALWAGPLATCLLGLAGAHVVKLESRQRPDAMRAGDPALFARLNTGKDQQDFDFIQAALVARIARADIVIAAARPRALAQLGLDPAALVAARPPDRPLVWLTITGHGATGEAAGWVGFGDDCGVAGGLTDAMVAAGGAAGFVGDAMADPLTGIVAARAVWAAWRAGTGCAIALAMSGVVAEALAEERAHDAAALNAALRGWSEARGAPFPTPC